MDANEITERLKVLLSYREHFTKSQPNNTLQSLVDKKIEELLKM